MLLPHLVRRNSHFPFDAFENLHREFDRFFTNRRVENHRDDWPPVNIWKTETGLHLRAEIPGVSPENLEISVHENRLSLTGKRPAPELDEKTTVFRQERDYGEFERKFELPYRIDAEKVRAEIRGGILELELPQLEADRPRKIDIRVQ